MKPNRIKSLIFSLIFVSIPVTFATISHAETILIEFHIANMQSLTDQYKVRKILSALEGVEKIILTDLDKMILLTFDDELSSQFDVTTALAAQGYPATNVMQPSVESSPVY